MIPLFWISLVGLLYIYIGYPVGIWLKARMWPRAVDLSVDPGGSLSVILVTHNEGGVLARKVDGLLASTIADRVAEIIVASDASTDHTEEVLAGMKDPRVHCIPCAERRGKAAGLNDAVGSAAGDILILTDARQDVASDALEKLVRCLGDESVGVVSGELVFRSERPRGAAAEGLGAYWRYETFIRRQESLAGSVPGATGALYAMRRDLFCPLPTDTLLDDVFLPMKAMEQGFRCVLASGAFVYDEAAQAPGAELARKRRTLAGCVQLARRYPRWLLRGSFFSHKIARLASPLLLLGVLGSSWAVSEWLFIAQVFAYAGAALIWVASVRGIRIPVLGAAAFFVALNLVTLAALWDGLRGRYHAAWKVAERG